MNFYKVLVINAKTGDWQEDREFWVKASSLKAAANKAQRKVDITEWPTVEPVDHAYRTWPHIIEHHRYIVDNVNGLAIHIAEYPILDKEYGETLIIQ